MEKQPKDTVGLQPTEPNTLYQKPTNHARRMPMEQNKREQFIIRRIGGDLILVDVNPKEVCRPREKRKWLF